MGFSLVRSLVKFTVKNVGDGLTGGLIPVGSIITDVYEDWRISTAPPAAGASLPLSQPSAAAQAQMVAELQRIAQDVHGFHREVKVLLANRTKNEEVRRQAGIYLSQVPGRIQASMRRPEDPTGRTVPAGLVLRKADDLRQFLPDRMPRFKAGDLAVPGTDLVVQELLGVGGFGEVWKAVHRERPHAPPVALKFCTDPAAVASLRKEVELLDRVLSQGRHRGIVELKYFHLSGDTPCLEYEYVDGGDLAGLILDLHKAGRAHPSQMAKILLALTIPVGFAHRLKPPIVHRDIKPQNVLTMRVDGKWQIKVADFGIGGVAREATQAGAETTPGLTGATQSAGSCTPLYASPQQRRFGPPDPRDDVYALGVIWHQMLAGDVTKEPPRGGGWKKKLLEQGGHPEMIALLESCVEDDPAERPADAQVLAERLSSMLKATPGAPPPPQAAVPPPPQARPAAAPAPQGNAHPPCPYVLSKDGLVTNPEPRLPCILLLDVSKSMNGPRIEQLSYGLEVYQTELQADDLASQRVEVAVLTFGSAVELVCPFTTADQFRPPALHAAGKTALGRAVHWAADLVHQRRRQYREHGVPSFRPWIFLLTDGGPTDEWQSAARRVREGEASGAFLFHAVGVEGADLGVLQELTGRPANRLNGLRFQDLFRWLSQSQRSVSQSRPGQEDRIPFANPAGPGGWALQ